MRFSRTMAQLATTAFMVAAAPAIAATYSYSVIDVGDAGTRFSPPAINEAGFIVYTSRTSTPTTMCGSVRTTYPSSDVGTVASFCKPASTAASYTLADINNNNVVAYAYYDGASSYLYWVNLSENPKPRKVATYNRPVAFTLVDTNKLVVGAGGLDLVPPSPLLPPAALIAPGYQALSGEYGASPNGHSIVFLGNNGAGSDGLYATMTGSGATMLKAKDANPYRTPYGQLVAMAINDSGQIAFTGRYLPGYSGNVNGLFVKAGNQTRLVAAVDNGACPTASLPCDWTTFDGEGGGIAISDSGDVVSTAVTLHYPGVTLASLSVVLNGDLDNPVASAGLVVDATCTATQAMTGGKSINDAGQIAILIQCANGTQRVVVATPAPIESAANQP